MAKDQREVLTRESLQKELSLDNRAGTVFRLLFSVSTGAATLLFSLIIGFAAEDYAHIVLPILWGIWGISVAVFLADYIWMRSALKRGVFFIKKDEVTELAEEMRSYPSRGGRRYQTVYMAYFTERGKIQVDSSTFEIANVGDDFYLVYLPAHFGRKPRLVRYYNSRFYRLENEIGDGAVATLLSQEEKE